MSSSNTLNELKPRQSQLTVRVWWSSMCYWFCQSLLPQLNVGFKSMLKCLLVQRKKNRRWTVVDVKLQFCFEPGCYSQRVMPVGTVLAFYDNLQQTYVCLVNVCKTFASYVTCKSMIIISFCESRQLHGQLFLFTINNVCL